MFYQRMIHQNKTDLLFVKDNELQCVLGSSFSASLINNKPTNKVFFFYSVLESAVVNISSS